MVRTGTRYLEEIDRVKTPAAEAAVIAVTIAGKTRWQINIHLIGK